MRIETFSSRFLKVNSYLVACDHTRKAMLIDPLHNLDPIVRAVKKLKLQVVAIVNTHTHLDHCLGNRRAKAIFNTPIMVHESEADMLTRVSPAAWLGGSWRLGPAADRKLKDGDEIEIGSMKFQVIHTPGHTPGGICLRHKKNIFCGDTIFRGSIGRTDLKGGDYDTLVASIKNRLFVLSDDIFLYPGHGPRTTIETERKYNLYVRIRPEQIDRIMFEAMTRKMQAEAEEKKSKDKGKE